MPAMPHNKFDNPYMNSTVQQRYTPRHSAVVRSSQQMPVSEINTTKSVHSRRKLLFVRPHLL